MPQWARYELTESLASLEDGVAHARAAADESVLAGGPLFRVPLVLTWLGRLDEAEARALECCEVAERAQYPLELGLPLAALTQIAVLRGDFDQAEQYAHRVLLIQRLSGYHWAAGLFLPALACAHVARGQFELAREALATWAETADAMELATVELLSRYVTVSERGLAVQGEPLPGLPRDPLVGADGWAAAAVVIARREGAPGDVRHAHDLLVEIERRGGMCTSPLVTLVPRILGTARDLLGDEEGAVAALRSAITMADELRADPERGRAQIALALILLRRGERRAAVELLDPAVATFRRLGMDPEAERATLLAGPGGVEAPHDDRLETNATAVIFFSDVVDSTRLTEELGVVGYRMRARQVEIARDVGHRRPRRHRRLRHQPRRRVHRACSRRSALAVDAAQPVRRRTWGRPACTCTSRSTTATSSSTATAIYGGAGELRGAGVWPHRARRDPRVGARCRP